MDRGERASVRGQGARGIMPYYYGSGSVVGGKQEEKKIQQLKYFHVFSYMTIFNPMTRF